MKLKQKNCLRRTESGVAAIEFALLLPLLLILFFGSFEVARYIVHSRKLDNAVSDIGLLISREGVLRDSSDVEGKGAQTLNNLKYGILPMLVYPLGTQNFDMEMKFIGKPSNAQLEPDDLRVMWTHAIFEGGTIQVNRDAPTILTDTGQSINDNAGGTPVSPSTYSDSFGQRAKIVFEGQSFILVNFTMEYDQIIPNFGPFLGNILPSNALEKVSTYAVRSDWDDENDDGKVQPSEFKNELHICTDCNVKTSADLLNEAGTTYVDAGRQRCLSVEDTKNQSLESSSGCEF